MNRINIRKMKIGSIVVFIILMLSIGAYSFATSPLSQAGYNYINQQENIKTLAVVDGFKIDQSDIEKFKYGEEITQLIAEKDNSDYNSPYKDDHMILQKLIENRILLIEAQNKGLLASEDEVNKYMEFVVNSIESSDDVVSKSFKELASGLGMTVTEYVELNRDNYRLTISTGYLQRYYLKDIEDQNKAADAWDKIKQEIVQEYQNKIEVFE